MREMVFFLLKMGRKLGRLVFELRNDKAPNLCENFVRLCDGSAKPTFTDTRFFRITEYVAQGGDTVKDDGSSGESALRRPLAPEWTGLKHVKGSLSMTKAPLREKSIRSQFFITLCDEAPWLDGKHPVIGNLVQGHQYLDELAKFATEKGKPRMPVFITISGICRYHPIVWKKYPAITAEYARSRVGPELAFMADRLEELEKDRVEHDQLESLMKRGHLQAMQLRNRNGLKRMIEVPESEEEEQLRKKVQKKMAGSWLFKQFDEMERDEQYEIQKAITYVANDGQWFWNGGRIVEHGEFDESPELVQKEARLAQERWKGPGLDTGEANDDVGSSGGTEGTSGRRGSTEGTSGSRESAEGTSRSSENTEKALEGEKKGKKRGKAAPKGKRSAAKSKETDPLTEAPKEVPKKRRGRPPKKKPDQGVQ